MLERVGMDAAGDQPGEMRHVDHENGTDPIGNRGESLEIDDPRIGGATGNDQLKGPVPQPLELVHIDPMVIAPDAIGTTLNHLPDWLAGDSMGQVAAGGKIEAHEGVAGLQQGKKNTA